MPITFNQHYVDQVVSDFEKVSDNTDLVRSLLGDASSLGSVKLGGPSFTAAHLVSARLSTRGADLLTRTNTLFSMSEGLVKGMSHVKDIFTSVDELNSGTAAQFASMVKTG